MADIFISYASGDRERAHQLALALEAEGWSVWWDRALPFGRPFDQVIRTELESAGCVVALWTESAAESLYVIGEARHALKLRKLISVFLARAELPYDLQSIHGVELHHWRGETTDPDYRRLVRGIAAEVGTPKTTSVFAPQTKGEVAEEISNLRDKLSILYNIRANPRISNNVLLAQYLGIVKDNISKWTDTNMVPSRRILDVCAAFRITEIIFREESLPTFRALVTGTVKHSWADLISLGEYSQHIAFISVKKPSFRGLERPRPEDEHEEEAITIMLINEKIRVRVSTRPGWFVNLIVREPNDSLWASPLQDGADNQADENGEVVLPGRKPSDYFKVRQPVGEHEIVALQKPNTWRDERFAGFGVEAGRVDSAVAKLTLDRLVEEMSIWDPSSYQLYTRKFEVIAPA